MSVLCCPVRLLKRQGALGSQPGIETTTTRLRSASHEEKEDMDYENHSTSRTARTFSSARTALTYHQEDLTATDIKDLLREVQHIEHSYSKMTRHRRLAYAVEQVVHFYRKFAPSADVLAQGGGCSSQFIWGSLRILLTVSGVYTTAPS